MPAMRSPIATGNGRLNCTPAGDLAASGARDEIMDAVTARVAAGSARAAMSSLASRGFDAGDDGGITRNSMSMFFKFAGARVTPCKAAAHTQRRNSAGLYQIGSGC